jgi:hypothetical protein
MAWYLRLGGCLFAVIMFGVFAGNMFRIICIFKEKESFSLGLSGGSGFDRILFAKQQYDTSIHLFPKPMNYTPKF